MIVKKHLHIYERILHKTRKDLFKCSDPLCDHRINASYLEGRLARCFLCGGQYVVRKRHLYLRKLHCDGCTRSTKASVSKSELGSLEKALEKVLDSDKLLM